MRNLRRATTSLLVTALFLGGVGLAQGHARGGFDAALRARGGFDARSSARDAAGPASLLVGRGGLPLLGALPIGTSVEVAFYDADPADGAAAVTTLGLTVGRDSEVAFAEAFAAARADAAAWESAYLIVAIGEQTRTIDLPLATDGARGLRAGVPLRIPTAGMSDGDTIGVTLYAGDPDDGGSVLETITFAFGVDSEIGFRAAVRDALDGADAAVVTISPRSTTIDLGALGDRIDDARARFGAMAERMGERRGGVEPGARQPGPMWRPGWGR